MRRRVKRLLQATALLFVLPVYSVYEALSLSGDRNACFSGVSQFLSLVPGKLGSYLRAAFFRLSMEECSQEVVISFGSLFSQTKTRIDSGVYIGPQCNIGSSHIGADCLIGSGVHILSGKNQHSLNRLDIPVRDQGGVFTMVSLGEDTWVGNGAIVMADVGKHCVVAAGAVVTQPVNDYEVVAGNPASVVRSRR